MKDETILTLAGIAAIIILDTCAMMVLHIDGVLMSGCIASIAGLIGYKIREIKQLGEFVICQKPNSLGKENIYKD